VRINADYIHNFVVNWSQKISSKRHDDNASDILKDLIGLHEAILDSDDIIIETKKLATNSNERKVFKPL
jgi:hypothetical protein